MEAQRSGFWAARAQKARLEGLVLCERPAVPSCQTSVLAEERGHCRVVEPEAAVVHVGRLLEGAAAEEAYFLVRCRWNGILLVAEEGEEERGFLLQPSASPAPPSRSRR